MPTSDFIVEESTQRWAPITARVYCEIQLSCHGDANILKYSSLDFRNHRGVILGSSYLHMSKLHGIPWPKIQMSSTHGLFKKTTGMSLSVFVTVSKIHNIAGGYNCYIIDIQWMLVIRTLLGIAYMFLYPACRIQWISLIRIPLGVENMFV